MSQESSKTHVRLPIISGLWPRTATLRFLNTSLRYYSAPTDVGDYVFNKATSGTNRCLNCRNDSQLRVRLRVAYHTFLWELAGRFGYRQQRA